MKPLRAFNVPLSELENAVFFRGEEEFEPHYVITVKGSRISRVNVWGVITRTFESENNFASVSIDDFTGSMDVNAFNDGLEMIRRVKKGDTVRVIGKVRENNNGLYVLAEGIQKLSFREEMLKRLQNIEGYRQAPEKVKRKKRKIDLGDFRQASELKVEREVIG